MSYAKIKGIMNAHAKSVPISASGDGVSKFAKRRAYAAIVKRSSIKGVATFTHEQLCAESDMSKSHSENTLKSLKKDGFASVSYLYGYKEGKRVVIGTKVILFKMRQWLKSALSKVSDLTAKNAAQLLYSFGKSFTPHKNIKKYRQYLWIDSGTGEMVRSGSMEMVGSQQ